MLEAACGREQREKNTHTHTNLWMGRNKGQDKPSPLLHGRPAVWPRPRLREALWNDVPPKGNRGKRHPVAFRGMASLSFWMRLVAQRFLLACCVYSVPLHATYIPKTHIWLFFFFLFISTLIFFLLIFAWSRKLLGHWVKPYPLKRLCSTIA